MLCRPPVLLLTLCLLASTGVRAADPTPAGPAKQGNTLTLNGAKVSGKLTRDQLRQCLSQQKSLQEQDAEAARMQASLDEQAADIARQRAESDKQGAELEAERSTVDATKADAVDAFNARLNRYREIAAQRDAAIAAYNERLRPFNEQVQVLNATRQGWVADCGNRTYDELDFYAIQRGK